MASRALLDSNARALELADIDVVLIEPRHDGPYVIWVESSLKDRFILEPHARQLFRVEYY